MSETHWYPDDEPLWSEEDGQTIKKIYSKKVNGKWEYGLFITYDDGEPLETVYFRNGEAR